MGKYFRRHIVQMTLIAKIVNIEITSLYLPDFQ